VRILLSTCAVLLLSTAPAAAAPKQDFTFSPTTPTVGQPVTFTPSPTRNAGRATADWDFQNDSVPDLRNVPVRQPVTYSYPEAGTFNVRMLVRKHGEDDEDDDDDEDDEDDDLISVVKPIRVNAPPVVRFSASPAAPVVGQEVFLQSFSYDPDGAVVSQRWDLDGDGDFKESANGQTAFTIFTRAGEHFVRLEVRDSDGGLQTETQTITVKRRSIAPLTPAGLALMNPFPVVRLAGSLYPRGVKVRALEAKKAPPQSMVSVLCAGKSCPSKKIVKTAEEKRVRFKEMTRFLREGTIISVSVRKGGLIGKYTRWLIRGGKLPKRKDLCVYPNRRKPARCPAA
jgi:PKD repeat protein